MRFGTAGIAILVMLAASLAGQLPDDFAVDPLSTDFGRPVALDFLPDGRILIAEQVTGDIKVFAAGAVGTLGRVRGVNPRGLARGLLGLAVDPGWPSRPYVYACYTHGGPPSEMRVVMFPVSGALTDPRSTKLSLGPWYDMLVGIPDQDELNNAGALRFGPDGMLYVSLGDDHANPCDAQRIDDLRGVLLRLDVARMPGPSPGPPPPAWLVPASGNPFSGPNDNARLTFAYGLRNPFRFQIDPQGGDVFIGDVGESGEEEVDLCNGGENFGWPWLEGRRPLATCGPEQPPTVLPIATYMRQTPGSASVVLFAAYRNRLGAPCNFGNAYEGDVFYLDFFAGWIRRLQHTGAAWVPAPPVPGQPTPQDWAKGFYFVTDARLGPDGAIYFLLALPGSLHRLRRVPRLPGIEAPAEVRVGRPLSVRCRRDPGDRVLLALGFRRIAPLPLPGAFGQLEIEGVPVAGGAMDAQGQFHFLIASTPVQVSGVTLHFQCAASAGGEHYLSPPVSVRVVP